MKFFWIIAFTICQYFLGQFLLDARPTHVKRYVLPYQMDDNYQNNLLEQMAKRKGLGWGKRSDSTMNEHQFDSDENSNFNWFDEK